MPTGASARTIAVLFDDIFQLVVQPGGTVGMVAAVEAKSKRA